MSPYRILGIDETCTDSQLTFAYRKLTMLYHPDRGGDAKIFIEIADAYKQAKKHREYKKKVLKENLPSVNKDVYITYPTSLEDMRTGIDTDILITLEGGGRKIVHLKIHQGFANNDVVTIAKCGDNSIKSLTPGDLYVTIKQVNHPRFIRTGSDCILHHTISVADAMLGNRFQIIGVDNKSYTIVIKAGTQPNTIITIDNGGFLQKNTCKYGNLVVHLRIEIPRVYDKQTRICDL